MENIKIALVGYKGKMGSVVFEALAKNYSVIGIGRNDEICENVQLVIDFASAESSAKYAEWCKQRKIPLIIGSTGQNTKQMESILSASKATPIFMAGNFSVGANNLKSALKNLITQDAQDVIIFEKHHKTKKDAPSGTAKEIAKFITHNFNIEPNIVFERGGKEIGTHLVDIYYENELVTIEHKAFSRQAFADGVMKAVKFMQKVTKSGFYSMEDIKIL